MALKAVRLDMNHIRAIDALLGGSPTDYVTKLESQFGIMRNAVGTTIAQVMHESEGNLDDGDTIMVKELLQLYYRTTAFLDLLNHLKTHPELTEWDPSDDKMTEIIKDTSEFTAGIAGAVASFKTEAEELSERLKAKVPKPAPEPTSPPTEDKPNG